MAMYSSARVNMGRVACLMEAVHLGGGIEGAQSSPPRRANHIRIGFGNQSLLLIPPDPAGKSETGDGIPLACESWAGPLSWSGAW